MNTSNLIALFGLIVTAIGLLITIAKEWSSIIAAYNKSKYFVKSKSIFAMHRRKLIFFIGSIVGLLAMMPIGKILYKAKKANFNRDLKLHNDLILNKKSGVVHHKKICADHMPIKQNTSDIVSSSKEHHIHRSKEVYIAETLSRSVEDPYKEKLLIEAIKNSPTSTHLYSPLIKMWGRNKEYGKIHAFLLTNIEYLQSLVERPNFGPRLEKKYRKALLEVKQQQNRATYLEKMSKII